MTVQTPEENQHLEKETSGKLRLLKFAVNFVWTCNCQHSMYVCMVIYGPIVNLFIFSEEREICEKCCTAHQYICRHVYCMCIYAHGTVLMYVHLFPVYFIIIIIIFYVLSTYSIFLLLLFAPCFLIHNTPIHHVISIAWLYALLSQQLFITLSYR